MSLNPAPAPEVQPGIVTGQSPAAGHYVRPGGKVVVTVAETPSWRPLTSLTGTDGGHSVPFRVRGTQWRVVYRMSYVGTCTFIFFCRGPGAQIIRSSNGSAVDEFGLNDGESQSVLERSGPGVYEVRITPGSDTARWSIEVQDYY